MKNEWLEHFKLAVIEKDFDRLEKLHREMPAFETLEEMVMAKALIAEALKLLQDERNKVKGTMDQIKRSLAFQNNAYDSKTKFDKSF